MTQTTDRPAPEQVHEVDLAITGMTCASCSARIEKKLGKLDGVDAVVNLATEKATVRFAEPVTVEQLLSTVRATGYGAEVVEVTPPTEPDTTDHLDHRVAPEDALRRRALVAAVLTVPVVVLAMVPGIDLPNSAWIQLALATPVVLWCGLPFHRAAVMNARHGASTMDTLVSIGVLTAYLWSAVVVLTGRAAGMSSIGWPVTSPAAHLWFETATVVTTFLLFGRWMEARATDRTRDALRGLLSLGAKDVAVERVDPTSRATTEVRIPVDELLVGETGSSCAPARRSPPTAGSSRAAARSTPRSSPVSRSPSTSRPVTSSPAAASTPPAGWSSRPPGSGPTRRSAGIARLVERAQTTKAPVQRLADRVSRRVRARRARARRADLRRVVDRHRRRRPARSRWRSPCSSSPARARSASPRPPRSWSAPVAARASASSSRAPTCSRTPVASTRSCSTRPAPSPPAR